MWRLVRRVLLAFAIAGSAGAEEASQSSLTHVQLIQALEQVAWAGKNLHFSGTFVIQKGGLVETCKITHFGDRSVDREKIERIDGDPLEITRFGNEVMVYMPRERFVKRKLGVRDRSFPSLTADQLATIGEHYNVVVGDLDRIAGRFATHITLEPKDKLRLRHELWIDQRTALQLKAQMFNERGELVEQIMFTDLSVGEHVTREMTRSIYEEEALSWRVDRANNKESGKDNQQSVQWEANSVPPGFKQVMEVSRVKGSGGRRIHLVYSDGFAAVSVFIESRKKRGFKAGLIREGVINVYRRIVNEQYVTIIGDAPEEAVRLIGDSIVRR